MLTFIKTKQCFFIFAALSYVMLFILGPELWSSSFHLEQLFYESIFLGLIRGITDSNLTRDQMLALHAYTTLCYWALVIRKSQALVVWFWKN